MEFIRTLREKSQTQRQATIRKEAEVFIKLADFDNSLYIAYNDTPLVPIDSSWTSVEILQELDKLRQNYINSKLKECGLPRIAASL